MYMCIGTKIQFTCMHQVIMWCACYGCHTSPRCFPMCAYAIVGFALLCVGVGVTADYFKLIKL